MSDVHTSQAEPAPRTAAKAAGVSVRTATAADAPEIMRLLRLMHAESGMQALDEDCAREVFDRAFQKKGGIIGVIGPQDDIHGMICLLITRSWYTSEFHLEELFNYVRPDARKSDHAKTLIRFAAHCSDQIGIPLMIGVLTNRAMAAKVRLYRQVLGYPAGAFFVYGAKDWANSQPANEEFWLGAFPETTSQKRRIKRLKTIAGK